VFERFTEAARSVVVLAQDEARTLKHNYIGTEHILLGLLREEAGLAARALESLGVTLERTRAEVLKLVGSDEEVTPGQIPFTPRAKKVLELALREALSLGHNYIGTEHILLGLLGETEGVAARILVDFGADAEKVRTEVTRLLPAWHPPEGAPAQARVPVAAGAKPMGSATLWARIVPEIRERLGREADAGDLLLLLASIPDSLVARTLAELGADDAALDDALERAREQGSSPADERLELLRAQRAEAEAEGDDYAAAQLRAEELRARREHSERLLEQVRARLGLVEHPGPGLGEDGPP
jgi:Clp amino terminal domain, pathogenicity island component